MKKRNLAIMLLLLLTCVVAVGQVKIKGKVLDEKKEAIIGATIIEKGTKTGTVTDMDGNFSITVSNPKATLLVSYVGMKSETVAVNGQASVTVRLESSAVELQEVVAVGYGTMRKRDLNGSISSIKVKDAETVPVVSVDQMLKGKSSGVFVNSASAEPGGYTSVKIRGVNSLNGDTEPLYVVDGVAMDNVNSPGSGTTQNGPAQKTNPLAYLNPQDIVNIEVLKDASATAIFGSRGSNGVVLITTKSGVSGTPKVNLVSSLTVSTIRKKIDMLDGRDYARYRNELAMVQGTDILYGMTSATSPDNLHSINWQDEVLQTAISNTNRVSISGGNKTSNYYISAGLENNEGLMKNTSFSRRDVRYNANTDLSDKWKMEFGISYADVTSEMTQTTGNGGSMNWSATRSMVSKMPILTIVPGIESSDAAMLNSPTAWVNDYKNTNTEANVLAKLGLTYKINKIFSLKVLGSYNFKQSERFLYYGRMLADYANGGAGYGGVYYKGYNVDALLNFNHAFNKDNNISGVIGTTYSSSNIRNLSYFATGFSDDILRYEAMGPGNKVTTPLERRRFQSLLNSVLGRVTYNLKDKYILTLSGRVDGSSKFPKGKELGFFPSTAFAWRVKQESFLKHVDAISNLKVRIGWGQTGNQNFPVNSANTDFTTKGLTTYNYGGTISQGRYLYQGNENLIWESSNQYNAGIDFGLFNERFTLTVDVYTKENTDMIMKRPLPPSIGIDPSEFPQVNFGTLENKGIDISISAILISKKNLKWSVDGNISMYRNKVAKLGLERSSINGLVSFTGASINTIGPVLNNPANIFIEGKPAAQYWGYQTAGIFQNQAQIDKFATDNGFSGNWYFNRLPLPGDIIYVNNKKDGKLSPDDYAVLGNPNPDFTWGLNSNLTYKQWGLAIGLNGVQGRDILNANLNTENLLNGSMYNVRKAAWYGAWRGEGTSNYYPRLYQNMEANYVTDRLIEDASYVRLSNVTLSYSPQFKNFFIKDLKLFVTGSNLLTLTKYSGFDPEVDSYVGDGMRVGIDNNSYPTSKSVIFGINANF